VPKDVLHDRRRLLIGAAGQAQIRHGEENVAGDPADERKGTPSDRVRERDPAKAEGGRATRIAPGEPPEEGQERREQRQRAGGAQGVGQGRQSLAQRRGAVRCGAWQ
jgi:uncharacterized sporulation protein YeaH/YhbH (DUF444 family)